MNIDFRLSTGYFEHPKIQKLGRKLGDSAVLSHIRLLRFVAVNRPDGNLSGMDALDIALAGGYAGDEDAFLSALLDARLIDRDGDSVCIHHWLDHNDYAAGATSRKIKARDAANVRWGNNAPESPPPSNDAPAPKSPIVKDAPAPNKDVEQPLRDAKPNPSNAQPSPGDANPDLSNANEVAKQYPSDISVCSEHTLALPDDANPDLSNAPASHPSHPSLPSYPSGLPTSEANPTTTTSLPSFGPGPPGDCPEKCPEAEVVVASLREIGVSDNIAELLVQRKGCQAALKQIEWLPSRIRDRQGTAKPVRDPASLLVKAIEDGYAVPASYAEAKTRQSQDQRNAEQSARRDREAGDRKASEQAAKDAGRAKISALRESLSPERQAEATAEATARFRQQFYAHAKKLDLVDGDPMKLPGGLRQIFDELLDAVILEREHDFRTGEV